MRRKSPRTNLQKSAHLAADDRWRRLLHLEPQPKDEQEGEEH
jgi:hypothetical protein